MDERESVTTLRQSQKFDLAVVGAGIVGLAHAYLAARSGLRVAVFERNPSPQGASLRNFGMIWPIGQPSGLPFGLAMRSRALWLEALLESGLYFRESGSLHATYSEDEAAVGREFAAKGPPLGYHCTWLDPEDTRGRTQALRAQGLMGALWSSTEVVVDPRQIMQKFPDFLAERFGVQFFWNTPVQRVDSYRLKTAESKYESNFIAIASGDDFQTLFPESFRQSGVLRCKLQMMRTVPQPDGWQLGPSLAFGLTFLHYPSFEICASRVALQERVKRESIDITRYGIHVLVSQTSSGELTIGDSHEYGLAVDIFDKPEIDRIILEYASRRLEAPALEIAQRWHGIYAKHPERPWLVFVPTEAVRILVVTSGIGMTMSFGLAEQNLAEMGVPLEAVESRGPAANRSR